MITRTHKTLAALLGTQLVLAAGLAAWSARGAMMPAAGALFTFDKDKADQITIEGPDKVRTDLARKGDRWVVAQAGDFAADVNQVTQLLARLSALKPGPTVATSSDAAERFKVADAAFERRIGVDTGGKTVATLLLGSTQGARQTFARKAGDNAVVSVDLATYEVPAKADDWLDKTVLRVAGDDLAAVEVAGLKLVRQAVAAAPGPAASAASAASAPSAATTPAAGASSSPQTAAAAPAPPTWRAEGLGDHERLDVAAADKLAAALADLRFNALRGRDDAARKDLTTPELTLGVQRRDGQRVDYRFYKLPGGDDRALVLSSRPETFTLASWQAKPLIDAAARTALAPASR